MLNKQTKKKFKEELDIKYPNRIIKRKQYWYKSLSSSFKYPKVEFKIIYPSLNNECILYFD